MQLTTAVTRSLGWHKPHKVCIEANAADRNGHRARSDMVVIRSPDTRH